MLAPFVVGFDIVTNWTRENPARLSRFFGKGLGLSTSVSASGLARSGLGHVPDGTRLGSAATVGSTPTVGPGCGMLRRGARPAWCALGADAGISGRGGRWPTIPACIDASGIGRDGSG